MCCVRRFVLHADNGVVFPRLCPLHFSAEVMYCTEKNAPHLFFPISFSNLSSSFLCVLERIFLCQFNVYAEISSITCTRTVWSKEQQSDENKSCLSLSVLNIVCSTMYKYPHLDLTAWYLSLLAL